MAKDWVSGRTRGEDAFERIYVFDRSKDGKVDHIAFPLRFFPVEPKDLSRNFPRRMGGFTHEQFQYLPVRDSHLGFPGGSLLTGGGMLLSSCIDDAPLREVGPANNSTLKAKKMPGTRRFTVVHLRKRTNSPGVP